MPALFNSPTYEKEMYTIALMFGKVTKTLIKKVLQYLQMQSKLQGALHMK